MGRRGRAGVRMHVPPLLLGAIVTALLLTACSPASPREVLQTPRLAFAVPPDTTYDLARAEPVDASRLVADLHGVSLLFLGEQHDEPRSHAWQARLLRELVAAGRRITVGLEMLPDAADPALEAWRQGDLSEAEFLARSGWYEVWGFPWGYYAEVLAVVRQHRLPIHGLNADQTTRQAVSAGDWSTLPAGTRAAIGVGSHRPWQPAGWPRACRRGVRSPPAQRPMREAHRVAPGLPRAAR